MNYLLDNDQPPPISRYPVPALEDLPEDIRERILKVQEKAGFIPNVFVTPRERAMLDFAVKVATDSRSIENADFEHMKSAGFSAEACWDIGAIVAFFALSNRMANLIAMRPNDEFYVMGRS